MLILCFDPCSTSNLSNNKANKTKIYQNQNDWKLKPKSEPKPNQTNSKSKLKSELKLKRFKTKPRPQLKPLFVLLHITDEVDRV